MAEFRPYTIHHLQWDTLFETVLPAGNHYVVIWRGRVPLGHLWVEPGRRLEDFRTEIAAMGTAVAGEPLAGGDAGLSVVVCTRNRPSDLARCIRALLASSDTDFELIVVDNASDDDQTAEVVAAYPQVRYVREERKGLDIARNTGGRMGMRALIAYTDDDVEVDKEWTRGVKAAFADPLVMAVTGLVIPYELQTRSQYIFERYWGFNKGYVSRTFDHRYFLDHLPYGVPVWDIGAGANMAFRREAFELAGWFDERLDVGASGCSGDSELWYRILAEGWNCVYQPQLVVYHHHRREDEALRRQLFYYMRGHVSSVLVQYERYGHEGERWRLRRGLMQYYWRRLKDRVWRRDRASRETFGTFFTEIKGCLSGWRFYRSVREQVVGGGVGSMRVESLALARGAGGEGAVALEKPEMAGGEPLVSVVIPCYNHVHYLPEAVRTVWEQTYKNVEVIVVDDGSTDGTAEWCQGQERVRYVRVERVGPSAARNIGVQHSRGEYVLFLDADDLLYPNALELNLYYFGIYPEAAFISGGHDRIDEQGGYLEGGGALVKAGDNYASLLQGNYIGMEATVLYRRELFFRFFFDPAVRACEDYDLNLRIARYFPVFGHAHKIAAYRIHGGNRSHDRKMMIDSALAVLEKQKKLLKNDEERASYYLGMQNWHTYYS